MRINSKLLPIKAHYFFFMAAMGPILPQLPVLGKDLGVSSFVMGTITGILPIGFLVAKPIFGLAVDIFRDYRKTIFMGLIVIMITAFALLDYVPPDPGLQITLRGIEEDSFVECNREVIFEEEQCNPTIKRVVCVSKCLVHPESFIVNITNSSLSIKQSNMCYLGDQTIITKQNTTDTDCDILCHQDLENGHGCLYQKLTFWIFVILLCVGSIAFNVVNSISDAICFDVIGQQFDYGKQRVWGTIGFGVSALIAGYAVDYFSGSSPTYTPALIIMIIFAVVDFLSCLNLELPIMEAPENVFKDLKDLMKDKAVVVFLIFAVFAGIVDSFNVYFLFWYLEDLAEASEMGNVKFLEGIIVAAETLGGEVIFFSISGLILERIGHVHCFSMCFVTYALRLGLISIVPSPWWIVPIELFLQGPTYALTYTTVVAYANELAPPGASATMQGIAAGMDDGFGYAIGSFLGGLLYKYTGGQHTLQIFSFVALLCGIIHSVIHKTLLRVEEDGSIEIEYKSPEEAIELTLNRA